MASKGASFERELCRQLSLWWSGGEHSDLCWRASQSGGRATQRAKSGKRTIGHCGDVCPTSSDMEPFFRFVTVEAKRGYNRSAFMADLLDRDNWPAGKQRKGTVLGMIEQAQEAARRAGTPHWMLVHKRDGREPAVYMPRRLFVASDVESGGTGEFVGEFHFKDGQKIVVMRLRAWLGCTDPRQIRRAEKDGRRHTRP